MTPKEELQTLLASVIASGELLRSIASTFVERDMDLIDDKTLRIRLAMAVANGIATQVEVLTGERLTVEGVEPSVGIAAAAIARAEALAAVSSGPDERMLELVNGMTISLERVEEVARKLSIQM
jgi:hypothetical protein